ncbi:MAG: SGNH/GDSL hydrolase family protein [Ferruginibacter sp.]
MNISYLALGDSYSIGEQVPIQDSFPYQTVQLLRNKGIHIAAPEIVAQTGWTTDELLAQIEKNSFLPSYNVVSLLIGVNNQYRGRTVNNFESEFNLLLQKAIAFAGGHPQKVFVLSIPDWGVTPFAAHRNVASITAEIDDYNTACKSISDFMGCNYIDITASQRLDILDQSFLVADKLHPSGKEYAKWARLLANKMWMRLK